MCKRLGSLLVHPVAGAELHHDAAGFASCCGPVICSPPHRDFVTPLRPTTSRSQPGVSYQGPWRLPGPDLHRQAALNLSLGYVISSVVSSQLEAPELLDALHTAAES
jgi:hypothetical protein